MANILIVAITTMNHCALVEQDLADDGHNVRIARNGTDAMDHVTRQRPDLVITDIAMPRYNGIELIQDILRHDRTIPVIIYSGYASYESTFMAWAADAFVLKSGDLTELKTTVDRLLVGNLKTNVQ